MSRDWDMNAKQYIRNDQRRENAPRKRTRDDIVHERNVRKYGDKLRRIR